MFYIPSLSLSILSSSKFHSAAAAVNRKTEIINHKQYIFAQTCSILKACRRISEDHSFFTRTNDVFAKTLTSPDFICKVFSKKRQADYSIIYKELSCIQLKYSTLMRHFVIIIAKYHIMRSESTPNMMIKPTKLHYIHK